MFWELLNSTESEEKARKIKEAFSINIKDTYKHKELISSLIKEIEASDKDEF